MEKIVEGGVVMTENENVVVVPEVEETKVTEDVIEEVPKKVMGAILNCAKLNVRKEPNANADVVFVADNSTEFVINEDESTEDWYKVCTDTGVEGFCMKKFFAVTVV